MKEFIETPFNYTGSKFKLLPQLINEFDYSKPYFIDLFTGGGSIYTNIIDKYDKVIANDIISDLIGIHKGLINSDLIIHQTKDLCTDLKENQEKYLALRDDYNKNKSSEKLWALILSCNSNLMRFNKSFLFNQTWGKRSWNTSTDKKVEAFTNHIREYKDKIQFNSKPFNEINIKSDKIMVYCDPPYTNTEAGYNCYWNKDDDDKLYHYLLDVNEKGSSFMISGVLNHGDTTSQLLTKLINKGFNYKELDYDYEKINKTGKNKNTSEIIIKNY